MDPETNRLGTALDQLYDEMRRQHRDALASFAGAGPVTEQIARSVARTGRLVLLGMGGSHCVNRVAESVLRTAGVDATAMVVSEVLRAPLPPNQRTELLTSQSGNSAEIVRYLDRGGPAEQFGLTMEPASTLGTRVPCLLGAGGSERSFAATRSLLISLALHAALAAAFKIDPGDAVAVLNDPPSPDLGPALRTVSGADVAILSGRGALQGLAEAGALGFMELARLPGLGLEGGQFRHGPIEVLGPRTGVILLRADDPAAALTPGLARLCIDAGAVPVIFDASGLDAVEGCVTLRFPRLAGLAAALALLPPLQRLVIDVAKTRVERVGEPVRSTKVVVDE